MDRGLLGALVSSIVCEVAILLLILSHSPSSAAAFSFNSVWPIVMEICHSSEAVTAATRSGSGSGSGRSRSRSSKRRRLMLMLPSSPNGMMGAASFKASFKMSAATFEWLCAQMEPLIGEKSGVRMYEHVGMGLLRLASGCSYCSVAQMFSSTEAMARQCTQRLCRLLCIHFRKWVAYPSPSALPIVSAQFHNISGLPNCCGAIDCTRFKFIVKGSQDHSVVTQVVADSCCRILNIITGLNGDKGDARVLRSSTLYADVEQGKLLNSEAVCVNGVGVPQYLVGDAGYPLLPWLMVPFADPVVASCQEHFNTKLHLMRQTALRTIACLSSWGILSKPIEEQEVKLGVACIGACAILHNIVLLREDGADSGVLKGIQDCSLHDHSSQYYRDANAQESWIEHKASLIRNALALQATDLPNSGHPFL